MKRPTTGARVGVSLLGALSVALCVVAVVDGDWIAVLPGGLAVFFLGAVVSSFRPPNPDHGWRLTATRVLLRDAGGSIAFPLAAMQGIESGASGFLKVRVAPGAVTATGLARAMRAVNRALGQEVSLAPARYGDARRAEALFRWCARPQNHHLVGTAEGRDAFVATLR